MSQNDRRRDALIELFTMLKESIKKDTDTTEKLVDQQFELVTQIKALPITELKDMLKEHNKESLNDIDECSSAVETKSNEILEKCKEIISKLNRLFWVIGLTVSILTAGYFIVRATVDNKKTFENWKSEITEEREDMVDELRQEIIDEMKRLHEEKKQNDKEVKLH